MKNSKQLRVFIVGEKECVFDMHKFHTLFRRFAAESKNQIGEYEAIVAEKLFVDSSAIHNWRMGNNGPGDLEKIHMLEAFWKLKENELLTEVDMPVTNEKRVMLTDREKTALKNFYMPYMDIWRIRRNTEGFQGYTWDEAWDLYATALLALENEYIDLKEKLYDKLHKLMERVEMDFKLEYRWYIENQIPYFDDDDEDPISPEDEYDHFVGELTRIIDPYLTGVWPEE